jgi:hypothetical protein
MGNATTPNGKPGYVSASRSALLEKNETGYMNARRSTCSAVFLVHAPFGTKIAIFYVLSIRNSFCNSWTLSE